jgi:hypothetical protein
MTSKDDIKQDLIDTFEDVKKTVNTIEGISRAGLMLGLQELGTSPSGFIGAYFPVSSNIIVINKTPLLRIIDTNQKLFKPYIFHVLLHEYIHSLGFLDERITEQKTYDISKKQFGENHVITRLAFDMKKFFPNLVYPNYGWLPPKEFPSIELVYGFDRSNTSNYIT